MVSKRNQADDTTAETAEAEMVINASAANLRPAQRAFLDMLTTMENIATEDTTEQAPIGDDVAAILLAETEEDMWDADELPRINAKVLSGCELELFGFEVKFSDAEEITTSLIGPQTRRKMYLLVRSSRLNQTGQTSVYRLPEVGQEFAWNTSARFIVAKLFWMLQHGRFDNGATVKARIQGTDLGGGKSVEKLKSLAAPVMAGQADQPPF